MNIYTIPISLEDLSDLNDDDVIDMSQTSFKCTPDKQARSAFLFIRNTSLNSKFDFSRCSYNMKVNFVNEYLLGNIGVNIQALVSTWIDILHIYAGYKITPNGIMDFQEIQKFIHDHDSEVKEILNFTISLPLASIQLYSSTCKTDFDMDGIEISDYDGINIMNMILISEDPNFMHLITPVNGMKPKFYNKYFNPKNNPFYGQMINALPYLGLLNIMFGGSDDIQHNFLDGLKDMIQKEDC